MKYLALLFILLSEMYCSSQELIPYRKNDKWGYCNSEGKIIINPVYDKAFRFDESGYAKVVQNDTYFIIDKNGILKTKNGFTAINDFNNGLAAVCEGGTYDYIQGEIINGKWGYISQSTFELTIPLNFARAFAFKDGYAIVQCDNNWGQWGVIDTKGNFILNCKYPTYSFDMRPFPGIQWHSKKHQLQIDVNGKGDSWNVIDIKGNKIMGPVQAMHGIYSPDPIKEKNNKLNKETEKKLEKQIANNNYKIKSGNKTFLSNGDITFINENLFLVEIIDSTRKSKFGVIDINFNIIIPFNYDFINYEIHDGTLLVKRNKLYGFYDTKGNEIVPCIYQKANNFENGLALVYLSINDRSLKTAGYVNKNGKQYFESKKEFFVNKINGKLKITDQYFNEINPENQQPKNLTKFENGYILAQYEIEYVLYDENLNEVLRNKYLAPIGENYFAVGNFSKYSIYSIPLKKTIINDIVDASNFDRYNNNTKQFLIIKNEAELNGVLSPNGLWFIAPNYKSITKCGNHFIVQNEKSQFGVIDSNQRVIKSFSNENLIGVNSNYCLVIKNTNAYEIFDFKSQTLSNYKITSIKHHHQLPEVIFIYNKSLVGIIDGYHNVIVAPSYKSKTDETIGSEKIKPIRVIRFTCKNNLYDLYNLNTGKFIIKGAQVLDFNNNLDVFAVKQNNKFFLLNSNAIKKSKEFDQINAFLRKDFFSACENQKCGLIDTLGKVILPFKYQQIYSAFDEFLIAKDNFIGVTDTAGKIHVPFKYLDLSLLFSEYTEEYSNYYFIATTDGMNYGIIDIHQTIHKPFELKGNIDFPFSYDSTFVMTYNKKKGVYRFDGKQILPQEFSEIYSIYTSGAFEREFILAKKENLFGLYTLDGKEVLPCVYDYIDGTTDFFNGDEQMILLKKDNKLGLMNSKCQIVIPTSYNNIDLQYIDDKIYQVVYLNGNCGLYKNFNTKITDCIYDQFYFDEEYVYKGIIPYRSNNFYGLLDTSGQKLTDPSYDFIQLLDDSDNPLLHFGYKGKQGVMNFKGEIVIKPIYSKVTLNYDIANLAVFAWNKKLFGVYNLSGIEILPCKMVKFELGATDDFPYVFYDQTGKMYLMNDNFELKN